MHVPMLTEMILVGVVLLYMASFAMVAKDPAFRKAMRNRVMDTAMDEDDPRLWQRRFYAVLAGALLMMTMPYVLLAVMATFRYMHVAIQDILEE